MSDKLDYFGQDRERVKREIEELFVRLQERERSMQHKEELLEQRLQNARMFLVCSVLIGAMSAVTPWIVAWWSP